MISHARRVSFACAFALCAAATGCYHERVAQPPQNADERTADAVMAAIFKSDMRPELSKFVPERRSELLDPKAVKTMHDYASNAGAFLGAREVSGPRSGDLTTRYFIAAFTRSDIALTITYDDSGKIVHYRLGGGVSDR